MPIRNHARMIQHLVKSYAEWWHLPVHFEDGGGFWILKGSRYQVSFPVHSGTLVPTEVENVQVPLDHASCMLPFPGKLGEWESIAVTGSIEFPVDLLTFLAGQLWRAEELETNLSLVASEGLSTGFLGDRYHYFDLPFVDLWMRYLFERVQGESFIPPFQKDPKFWMTYDIDNLQKWKLPGVIKHLLRFPLDLLQGEFFSWFRLAKEALQSHFPERDPWYTLPQMFLATRTITATFFWLGNPWDDKACRYDIRKKVYAKLIKACLQEKHQIGLHGCPMHSDKAVALAEEKSRVEGIAGITIKLFRQHCLKIVPGKTFRHLESLGFEFDSTLGFSDRIGFRCGSCIPIRWWDLEQGCTLNMIEIPFSIGDWTLHDPSNFDPNLSRHNIWNAADQVRLAGGILVFNFHDKYFSKDFPDHAQFHQSVLEGLWMRDWRDWHPEL